MIADAIASAFAQHPRSHWEVVFARLDACVTSVLTFNEAAQHPRIRARGSLSDGPHGVRAEAAPRFASVVDMTAPRSQQVTARHVAETWARADSTIRKEG
jgi:alpha-methylacyl-CoA racemase